MNDLFSSLLIFTIIKTILSTFFFTVSNFYKIFVKFRNRKSNVEDILSKILSGKTN